MLQGDIFVPHSFTCVLSLGHVNHDAECNNILSFRSVCVVVENGMYVKHLFHRILFITRYLFMGVMSGSTAKVEHIVPVY